MFMTLLAAVLAIQGTVRDVEGTPLPGVTVFIEGTQTSVVTGADGTFAITPEGGAAKLQVFLGGFESQLIDAVAGANVDVTLKLAAVNETLTVTATADRDVPMSTWQRGPIDIVRTPGAQADIFRALQTLPGVAKSDDGAGLFVRGGDVSEVLVTLDGATIAHPYRYESSSGGQFGAVEPFLLQGLAFSTGGFGARFGNALSGVLDLRGLGRPTSTSYTATAGLAGLSGRTALATGASSGIRFSGNIRFPRLLFAVNGAPREFDRYPGGWDLNASGHIGRLKIFVMEQRTSIGVQLQRESFDGFLHADSRHEVVAANWKTILGGAWDVSASAGADLYRNTTEAGVLDLRNEDQRLSWRVDASRGIGTTIVRIGTDGGAAKHDVSGVVPARGGDYHGVSGTRVLDVAYRDQNAGVYAEAERKWGRVTPTVGVRADRFARVGTSFDPRVNVVVTLAAKQQLRLAWGIYHQAPAAQYFDRRLVSELGPMRAEHRIAGYEAGNPDEPLHMRIEAYEKRYADLPLETATGFASTGFGSSRGLDVYLMRRWTKLELRGNYSFSDTVRRWTPHDQRLRFAVPDGTWSPDFSIPHALGLTANLGVTDRLSFGAAGTYASGRPFTPIIGADPTPNGYVPRYATLNSERLPPFIRADANVSYRVVNSRIAWTYFAGITNVLARRNAFEYAYSPDFSQRQPVVSAAPRSLYIGLSVTR